MNLKQEWVAYQTIVSIEWKRTLRVWSQTLLPPTITSILYFVIFGQVIGSRIGDMNGYQYIEYITPGLVIMNIITSSYTSAAFAFFSAKFQRNIEELLVAPVSNATILLGYASSGALRGLMVGAIVSSVALFFTKLHIHSLITIITTAFLAASLFSLAGIINAIYAKSFDDISIIPSFVLTPLTYLGGVFYSINLLPSVWQYVSLANPITYIVDNFRFGFLGIGVRGEHLVFSYTFMITFVIILFLVDYYFMEKGVGLRE